MPACVFLYLYCRCMSIVFYFFFFIYKYIQPNTYIHTYIYWMLVNITVIRLSHLWHFILLQFENRIIFEYWLPFSDYVCDLSFATYQEIKYIKSYFKNTQRMYNNMFQSNKNSVYVTVKAVYMWYRVIKILVFSFQIFLWQN